MRNSLPGFGKQWDLRFLALADHISSWSKDESTKVGAVIIGPDKEIRSTGYNWLPRGANPTPDRLERPEKYLYNEHAERNAIYNGARIGISLKGCTLYSNFWPCMDCARAIIQSGIITIVSYKPDWTHERYGKEFRKSKDLMTECSVDNIWYEKGETNIEYYDKHNTIQS